MEVNSSSLNRIKITYRQKNVIKCPICRAGFQREEILTGRGRIIAGDLTDELRRKYVESKRYGRIYPLIYPVLVCPKCFFASFSQDFNIPINKLEKRLREETNYRLNLIYKLFPNISFAEDRTLIHGLASYILAMNMYSHYEKKYAPSLKRAICAIRASWCIDDLMLLEAEELKEIMPESLLMWDKSSLQELRNIFYKKAAYFYKVALEVSQSGAELSDSVRHYGPDVDKNFGYFGIIYMASLLNFRLSGKITKESFQLEKYEQAKRMLSKLFGSGKSDRGKPSDILIYARDLYREINQKIKELGGEGEELEEY